ncbi:FYVE zinc finger-domain-containing protein [Tricladium varicosporioides]|nr:FYVE zinc finger-domain-containing protein [Hymenoscyphus varicosporioides]
MDNSTSPIVSAHQSRTSLLDERPLPPVPLASEPPSNAVDSNESEVYERYVNTSHGTQNDAARQYELWRDSGFRGSPSNYATNVSEMNSLAPSSRAASHSRSRGNSTNSQHQEGGVVNEGRVNSSLPIDGLSRPRAESSARHSTHSNMSSSNNNSTSSSRERSISQSQSRYRRPTLAPSEVVVPRWQPDIEVTICPICRTQFSFFVRKHHCRKCGRVVCSQCSPHRITIPHQYIVRPPTESQSPTQAQPTIDPTGAGSSSSVTSLGGGERVRLCNPCVPDPNVAPPQVNQAGASQHSPASNRHSRSVSSANSPYSHYQSPSAQRGSQANPISLSRNAPRRPREPSILGQYYSGQPQSLQSRGPSSYNSRDERRPGQEFLDNRSRSSTVGGTSRDPYNMGNNSSSQSEHSRNRPGGQNYSSLIPRSEADLQRSMATLPRPPQPQRRPQIPEEDECWICHNELPSRTLPGFEALRSQHVESCIASAMQGSSSSSPPPPPAPATSSQTTPSASSSTSPPRPQPNVPPPPPSHPQLRRTGVFPYIATEKDCVDDAECTICLEEFEVGVEMGRLECFCRFHLKCIRDWFETKPGQCPVHQHGGGY